MINECVKFIIEGITSEKTLFHRSGHYFTSFKNVSKKAFGNEEMDQPIFFKENEEDSKGMINVGKYLYTCKVNLGKLFNPHDLYNWDSKYTDDPESITELGKKIQDEVYAGSSNEVFYLSTGAYDAVEDSKFLKWLKENGYNSFLVSENGKLSQDKSIGVFDPNSIKIISVKELK